MNNMLDSAAYRLNRSYPYKIELYKCDPTKGKWGTTSTERVFVKIIWADIKPTSGRVKILAGSVELQEVDYIFLIRRGAVDSVTSDMVLKFNGVEYEVLYSQPNFKYKDTIEIFCKMYSR